MKKKTICTHCRCCVVLNSPAVKNLLFEDDHSAATCQTIDKVGKRLLNQPTPSLLIATFMAFFLGRLYFGLFLCPPPPFSLLSLTYGNKKNPTLCLTWRHYLPVRLWILPHLPASAPARQKERRRKRSEVE